MIKVAMKTEVAADLFQIVTYIRMLWIIKKEAGYFRYKTVSAFKLKK